MQSDPAPALRRQSSLAGHQHLESSAACCQVGWDAPGSSWWGPAITAQRPQICTAHQNPHTSAAIPLLLGETSQATAADVPGTETEIIG